MRVGMVPLSRDFSAPGDRRRFWYYAQKRGIDIEIAGPSESYALVFLTQAADYSVWCDHAKSKLVLDQTDSYLAVSRTDPRALLRGLAKYLAGQSRHLKLDNWEAIKDLCRRADAVVCTTEEQKKMISECNERVEIILDFHPHIRDFKTRYISNGAVHFVWEGLTCR